METNLVKLKLVENIPDKEVIKHIEGLLQDAKDGSLIGLAYAVAWKHNKHGNGYTDLPNTERIIAELAKLQAKLVIQCNLK